MNSFEGMRVLSLVRDGDYAHAGEEEAIELAMRPVKKVTDRIIVDAGCGRGGTANYLQEKGWGKVVGFDIEPASIAAARKNYPAVEFHVCDVCDVDETIGVKADIVCLFNVYYCLPHQTKALRALRQVSKNGTQLVIFDHVDRGSYDPHALMDAGRPFLPNPPLVSEFPEVLEGTGWKIDQVEEVHDSYVDWYTTLVSRIEAKRSEIVAVAGAAGYDHVLSLYRGLLEAALGCSLGAAFVRAHAVGGPESAPAAQGSG
jgi:SAM-dependent methyltransferase